MKRFLIHTVVISLATMFLTHSEVQAAAPQRINFQSLLSDPAGFPVADGNYSVVFTIWNAAVAGTSVWTETQNITTSGGVFNVLLGSVNPVKDTVFNGTTRYLGIAVNGDPEVSPRTALVSVPYSQRVHTVDGAAGGNITSGVAIGTGHTLTGQAATITGGSGNIASSPHATISGGQSNLANWDYATVGGGSQNTSSGFWVTVGGGTQNTGSGIVATIGGGVDNTTNGEAATVAGGSTNFATADFAAVGGGVSNAAEGLASVVGGGKLNVASGDSSTVGGGTVNWADGNHSTVSGGRRNKAAAEGSTIGGGYADTASGVSSTIGGGADNTSSGIGSTVGGGLANLASGDRATVGGGYQNTAAGFESTVPGGGQNLAQGDGSFAAGQHASALHNSSFVWSDGVGFESTAPFQFLIRASAGVGIQTNDPQAPLDVNGSAIIRGLTQVNVLEIMGGADIAEGFESTEDNIEPGTVMIIDEEHPGMLKASQMSYDSKVAGVVSGAGGVQPGMHLGQEGLDGEVNVAITGRVFVKCTTEGGVIVPGDLLTTSSTAGCAMKATRTEKSHGAILGKAMGGLMEETGLVLVLVNLQ